MKMAGIGLLVFFYFYKKKISIVPSAREKHNSKQSLVKDI